MGNKQTRKVGRVRFTIKQACCLYEQTSRAIPTHLHLCFTRFLRIQNGPKEELILICRYRSSRGATCRSGSKHEAQNHPRPCGQQHTELGNRTVSCQHNTTYQENNTSSRQPALHYQRRPRSSKDAVLSHQHLCPAEPPCCHAPGRLLGSCSSQAVGSARRLDHPATAR